MMRYTIWALLLSSFAIFAACNRQQDGDKSLNEKEYAMDEPLSSLSEDGDSAFWLGSETGVIWHICKDEKQTYDLETDRIYDIVAEPSTPQGRVCWIGIRNSGIQKWRLHRGKMTHEASFPIDGKGLHYSAYDIHRAGNRLYIGTSQGLYTLNLNAPDGEKMKRLYPISGHTASNPHTPFVVNKLCRAGNFIFASSQDGLLRIDTARHSLKIVHQKEKINHVASYGNTVYALANKTLYTMHPDGTDTGTFNLKFAPLAIHKAGNILYLIGINQIELTQDGKHFVRIPLRRNIPASSHNVIGFDDKNGFTLMITADALWRIPCHLGIFSAHTPIVASCSNGNEIFYVNDRNELFCQNAASTEATKIYDFPDNEVIIDLKACNDVLYYINSNREVNTLTIRNQLIKNEIMSSPRPVYRSKVKVTAFHLNKVTDSPQILLGIQDGMVVLDEERTDTIRTMDNRYITSFYQPEHSDIVYMSTLNDGVFYGKGGDYKAISQTQSSPFIHDLIVTEDYQPTLIYLNNRHLIMHDGRDTVKVKGVNKLIYINDTLFYALPKAGIIKYSIRNKRLHEAGRYYADIHFTPQACFALDGHLYLGCDLGVLRLPINSETKPAWITFYTDMLSIYSILIALGSAAILSLLFRWVYVRNRKSNKRQMLLRIQDLKNRLSELSATTRLLEDADMTAIERLQKSVDSIDVNATDKHYVNMLMAHISEDIMRSNRNAALLLLKQFEKQTEEIKAMEYHESPAMAEASAKAFKSGSIENIKVQATLNRQWIDQAKSIARLLDQYSNDLQGLLLLPGITDKTDETINTIREDLINKPLHEVNRLVELLHKQHQSILGNEAKEAINTYMEEAHAFLQAIHTPDKVTSAMLNQLESIAAETDQCDRLALLRTLKRFDLRLNQLRTQQQLAECIDDYTVTRNRIVYENEQRINRKFDIQLNKEIAAGTGHYTKKIEQLIENLYADMMQTDPKIMDEFLKFSNYSSQQAKVLAILIAAPKVKRTLLPGMLGIYGNLNPVISRLVSGKIKPNEAWLQAYIAKHPTSLALYILNLSE